MQRNILSIVVCLLILGVFMFVNSSLFYIEYLEWTGIQYLTEEELLGYSGFSSQNILRIDTRLLANQVASHPWVYAASAKWSWPNILTVAVKERRPLAMVPIDSSWFLLDEAGVLMPPPLGIHMYALPLVTHMDPGSTEQLRATARMLMAIPVDLLDLLSEWNVAEGVFVTRQGTQIWLGDFRDLELKFETLELILADLINRNKTATRIDLRSVRSPVVIERK